MEKRKPHYDLSLIKVAAAGNKLRITASCMADALALGITTPDAMRIVMGMDRSQFFKSMTSYADPKIWQDVYRVPYDDIILYVKFTVDLDGHLIIGFKEK